MSSYKYWGHLSFVKILKLSSIFQKIKSSFNLSTHAGHFPFPIAQLLRLFNICQTYWGSIDWSIEVIFQLTSRAYFNKSCCSKKYQIPLQAPQRPHPIVYPNRVCVHFTFCCHECINFAWTIHTHIKASGSSTLIGSVVQLYSLDLIPSV